MLFTDIVWKMEPMHSIVFFLFLLAAVCVCAVRSARLLVRLYSFRCRKRVLLGEAFRRRVAADVVAKAALGSVLEYKSEKGTWREAGDSEEAFADPAMLQAIRAAEARFRYLWEMCDADVRALKRLARLTLLLAFVVIVHGAFPTFRDHYEDKDVVGAYAAFVTLKLLFARLAAGMSVCALLYAVSNVFETALMRRQASWRFMLACIENDCSGSTADAEPSH